MTIDKEDMIQAVKEERYNDFLEQQSDFSLSQYFKDMPRKSLLDYIKQEYGMDGLGDANYES